MADFAAKLSINKIIDIETIRDKLVIAGLLTISVHSNSHKRSSSGGALLSFRAQRPEFEIALARVVEHRLRLRPLAHHPLEPI